MKNIIKYKDLPESDKALIKKYNGRSIHTHIYVERDEFEHDGKTFISDGVTVYAKMKLWAIILVPIFVVAGILAAIFEGLRDLPDNVKDFYQPFKLFSYKQREEKEVWE